MIVEGYQEFGTMVAANAPNNSIFRDVADNILKAKDNSGVVSPVVGGGGSIIRESYFNLDLQVGGNWTGKGNIMNYEDAEIDRNTGNVNLIDMDFNDFLPNFTKPEFYIHSNEEIEEINFLLSTTSGIDAIGLVAWHWDEGNFPYGSKQDIILEADISAITVTQKQFSFLPSDLANINLGKGDQIFLFIKGTNLGDLYQNYISMKTKPV